MNKITIFYNDQQLNLYVDKNKANNNVQVNIVNPADTGHSVIAIFPVDEKSLLDNIAELERAVLDWDQLDSKIESAKLIFQNLPPAE